MFNHPAHKQGSMTAKTVFIAILTFIMVLGQIAFVNAQEVEAVSPQDRPINTLRDLNQALTDIAATVKPAVVTVSTERVMTAPRSPFMMPFGEDDGFFDYFFGPDREQQPEREFRQRGLGSGVIVSGDGHVLTNNHVVEGADSIFVRTYDGRRFAGEVIGTDPETDIAVLRINATDLEYIEIGDSDELKVGEIVLAVGSPMSETLAYTVTQGIVSAVGRSNVGLADYENFIQTDAAINRGNSGGPLVNLDGELVGINTAILSRTGGFQGIGFAVPSNMAARIMNSLLTEGRVVRGWLGVAIQDVTPSLAEAMDLKEPNGALVGDIFEESPAYKAGFEPGDVIIGMDGDEIENSSQLRNRVAATAPGTEVEFTVMRQGDRRTLDVTLAERNGEEAVIAGTGDTERLLGFTVRTLTDELATQLGVGKNLKGVVIDELQPHSNAYVTGLREGDIIQSVDRKDIANKNEFLNAIRNKDKGDSVLLRVNRQGSSFFLAFVL